MNDNAPAIPVQILERPRRPLVIGDIVVTSGGLRCRVVSLTPTDHGEGFHTVEVGLTPLPDDTPQHEAPC